MTTSAPATLRSVDAPVSREGAPRASEPRRTELRVAHAGDDPKLDATAALVHAMSLDDTQRAAVDAARRDVAQRAIVVVDALETGVGGLQAGAVVRASLAFLGRPNASTVAVTPLNEAAVRELVREVLREDAGHGGSRRGVEVSVEGRRSESSVDGSFVPAGTKLEDAHRTLVKAAMARHGDHKEAVAAELGISLKTLYNWLKDWASLDAARDIASR